MKFIFTLLLSIAITTAHAQGNTYVLGIKNVSVITMPEGIIKKTNFYIDQKNVAVTSSKIHKAKKWLDGTGKYLMSGLTDMHVHFPDEKPEQFFKLLTCAGITNCRIMKSTAETISFRQNHQQPEYPTMYVAYNFFASDTLSPQTIPAIIRSAREKEYDFIKIFGLRDSTYFADIMQEAKKNDMLVCGHALTKVSGITAITSGYKSLEHVGYLDKASESDLDTLLDSAAEYHTFICPTLDWSLMVRHATAEEALIARQGYEIGKKIYGKNWDSSYAAVTKQMGSNAENMKAYFKEDVRKKIEILKKIRARNIKVIAGSDAEEPFQTPGYSLIEELKSIALAGYNSVELLQMVTTNAIEFFATEKDFDPGYILLSKNPLTNINNLATVEFVIKKNEITDCRKLIDTLH